HGPISRRPVSLEAAIFSPLRRSGKRGTLARAARRASLHLQTRVRELPFRQSALSLEGGAQATPGPQQLAPPQLAVSITTEIGRCRARGAQPNRLRSVR